MYRHILSDTDINSITDNVILNYLNIFKHALTCYPEYLKECLNEQIPNCKTDEINRTVAERMSDNFAWMVTDLWMKDKISGQILKDAICLGYDLQQKGFFDPIGDNFIKDAWHIITSPSFDMKRRWTQT